MPHIRYFIQTTMCVYAHALFFLLINTFLVSLLPISLWKFIFCQAVRARALSLVPGGLVARIQHSHRCGLTSVSGWERKSCFRPQQAEAT